MLNKNNKGLLLILLFCSFIVLSSCGTILKPQNNFNRHSDRYDYFILGLDLAGLCLFIVPGIVAIVVDHSTGALYLSPQEDASSESNNLSEKLRYLQY